MWSRKNAYDEEYKIRINYDSDTKRMMTAFALFFQVLAFIAFIMYLVGYNRPIYGKSLAKIDWYIQLVETIPALAVYLVEAIWAIIKERNWFRILKLVVVSVAVFLFTFVVFKEMYILIVRWNMVAVVLFIVECVSFYRYKTYRELE